MISRPDLRLVPCACCLWVLAVVGTAQGLRATVTVLALTLAVFGIPALLSGRRDTARAIAAHGVLVLVGACLLIPSVQRAETTRAVLRECDASSLTVTISARLLEQPASPHSGPAWATGTLRAMAVTVEAPVQAGRRTVRLPAKARVLLTGDTASAHAGGPGLGGLSMSDVVRVRGRVSVEGTLVVVRVQRVERVDAATGVRATLRQTARQGTASLPVDESALVRGMTTGDTAGMSAAAEEAMRSAGLSHLVAVSGANIALVLGAVLGPLLLAGVRRRPRLIAAAVVAGGYVSLVGDQPSVLRAATMAVPVLAARWAGVRASPVSALAATICVWSVASPQQAASMGFVLSALATGGILVLAPPAARAITAMSRDRIGRAPALAIAVPLVAQLVCTPVLVLLSPEVSAWTVAANILVAPLVGPATVIGLSAVLLGPVAPSAASALWVLSAGAAHLVLIVAQRASELPGAHLSVPAGASGALLMGAVVAGVIGATAARRLRVVRWAAAVVAVALLAPPLARCTPWFSAAGDAWTVAACSVGQGDAVVLRGNVTAPRPSVVLVDTGPDPAALSACLDDLGVERIDLLVLTHPHADHVGGTAALTGDRRPRGQWICPSAQARRSVASSVAAQPVARGAASQLPGLRLDVLWPVSAEGVQRVAARETSTPDQGGANDCSVVLTATWPSGARFIGLGDLEPEAQEQLRALGPGRADLVKVAHHGSRRQDPELYAQLAPSLAIVEVGRDNTFGHPAPATLTMLDLLSAPVIRTDRDGTVALDPAVASDRAGTAASTRPAWTVKGAHRVGSAR